MKTLIEAFKDNLKVSSLSVTQINQYLRCPVQWEFRYVKGIKIPPAGAMLQGRVYHETYAENFKQKIQTLVDLPITDLADIYANCWDKEIVQNTEFSFSEILWDEEPSKAKDEGFSLVKLYRELVAPQVIPKEVEVKINKVLASNIEMTGRLDLVDDQDIIIDHKVSKRSQSQETVDRDLQASVYLWLKDSSRFQFHRVVNKKQKEVQILGTTRTEEQLRRVVNMILKTHSLMQTGIVPPRCDSFWCSKAFCGYFETCKARI